MFDWLVETVRTLGYAGVALLMFLENVFPPIPSEVIMPLAGFVAAQGDMNIFLVVLAGTLGSLAGALFWYAIGLWFGKGRIDRLIARHGRILTLRQEDLERARAWFRWKAGWAVFLGRLIPAIRTLISVPAGIAAMPFPSFLFWTALGTTLWTALLAVAGYILESQFALVEGYIDPLSKLVLLGFAIVYVWRFVTYRSPAPKD